MKKGLLLVMFSLMVFGVGLASGIEWCTWDAAWTATECVCDHTPNSTLGYGQVIIGPNIYSCSNIPDGVCPEYFSDPSTGLVGNCSSCLDPDCVGNVTGFVRDDEGKAIENALIMTHPISYETGINLERSTTTNSIGWYMLSDASSGTYYIGASKDGYDTQLLETSILTDKTTALNFTLNDGTCHDDCTDSYNRCNSLCDGVSFNDTNTRCQFYNETVKNLCANKLKGTEVFLGTNTTDPTKGLFIECCGDGQLPYNKYYTKVNASSESIKNMIRVQKIAKKDGVPVVIMINYWTND